MSPKRSNGTIMSAAVLDISGSACFALATRRFTPAGTASRSSANAAARARFSGSAISVSSKTPCRLSRRPNRSSGESGASTSSIDSSCACQGVRDAARDSSRSISSATADPDGKETLSLRSTPSSRITAIDRASTCSIAQTSTPKASRENRVSSAAARSLSVSSIARSSDGTGTSARHIAGGSGAVLNVTSAITPSVPSEPMNRSTMSMPGAMK